MPSNLVVSDYELTEAGFKLVRLCQELKDNPDRDFSALFREIDELVGAMRRMGDQVDDSALKIGLLEQQLDEAQKRHASLQTALQTAREDRDESLNDMETNWELEVSQLRSQIESILREKNSMSVKLLESQQDLAELRQDKEKLESYLTTAVTEKDTQISQLRDRLSSSAESSDYSDDLEDVAVRSGKSKHKNHEPKIEKSKSVDSKCLQTDEAVVPSLDETLRELEIVKDELRNRLLNCSPASDISLNSTVSLMEELAEVNAVDTDEVKTALGNLWSYSQSPPDSDGKDVFVDECLSSSSDCELDEEEWYQKRSSRRTRHWWLQQMLFWLALYLLVDIVCYHLFGVHIVSISRFTRGRRTAVF